MELKSEVKNYWENKVCGAFYGMKDVNSADVDLRKMEIERYRLEPYIPPFADFPSGRNKQLLEIGVGGGVDFSNWIRSGANATGIDLTHAGVTMTAQRLDTLNIARDSYNLMVGDAENLPFEDNSFDIVYSWGVLHHSPNTARAFQQVFRVLKPGGMFRGMIYHVHSWVGLMFWARYSLLSGKPWKSPRQAMYEHLESPGTKTYTRSETIDMLRSAGFTKSDVSLQLAFADLLLNKPRGANYQTGAIRVLWKVYPRWLIKLMGNRFGLCVMITAWK